MYLAGTESSLEREIIKKKGDGPVVGVHAQENLGVDSVGIPRVEASIQMVGRFLLAPQTQWTGLELFF